MRVLHNNVCILLTYLIRFIVQTIISFVKVNWLMYIYLNTLLFNIPVITIY